MGYFLWLVSFRLIWLNPGCSGADKKNVLCSNWEGEYVQGQSWTVTVKFTIWHYQVAWWLWW